MVVATYIVNAIKTIEIIDEMPKFVDSNEA